MTFWPGGDAYFGALLNSWIHVMMYSYYTLSLLKIPCPWKKYLTVAQLVQFTTVVGYTVLSFIRISKLEDTTWKHFTAHAVQVFEMTSLFVLFMHFYRKTYNKKKSAKAQVVDMSKKQMETVAQKDNDHETTPSVSSDSDATSETIHSGASEEIQ